MDPLQFAYQPGIGVDDAVIYLLQRSLSHLEDAGNTVKGYFFDFSSAFNTIHPSLLSGAPQGTVLSPFLFTLYTSDFTYSMDSCHLQKFSDDILPLWDVCQMGNDLKFPHHGINKGSYLIQCAPIPIPKARLYSISGPERKAMEDYIQIQEKCQIHASSVTFLRYVITANHIDMDPRPGSQNGKPDALSPLYEPEPFAKEP
ncbi:hypothetical protein L3Q82_003452 [Scortum barcoo]|uniref:Uncharacterized protein n=1 Tax=Scortum barcoo TaxID=214431 RepID=A0ACB8VMU4_9TELE|nr:hypothetical protein L3Q82_003452 [Scortum barcoo]